MAAGTSIKKPEHSKLSHSGYKDLGAIINYTDDTGKAQNEVVESAWYDNAEWVRNMILLINVDQQYDVFLYRRDSAEQTDWSSTILSDSSATSNAYAPISLIPSNTGSINAIVGYSFKFVIKNKAAGAMKKAILKCQVLGK
ncbi:MAG: hypothetical protein WC934_07610 [Acidithiobacillus sp.]|jgi:hypothetical protein|uniref:hypothetical protein n=1 Tax=Acidithiobacillus sp. TaxID=1872118 RepID=UPI00355E5D9C